MANYSWLAEKKAEEMKKKLVQRGAPNYRQLPISERYGATFTGMGPDGKLDRNAVAGVETDAAGRQHAFHEGEAKFDTPEGSLYINSDMVNAMNPQTQQGQAEASVYAKKGNLPGFASGGFSSSTRARNTSSSAVLSAPDPANTTVDPAINNSLTSTRMRIPSLVGPSAPETVNTPAPVINNSLPAGSQAAVFNPIANTNTAQTSVRQPIVSTAASSDNTIMNIPAQQGVQTETSVRQPVIAGQREAAPAENINIPGTPATPAATVTNQAAAITPKTEPTPYDIEGRRATDEQAMRQQQERSALEQRLIQQGVSPDRARLEGQMLRNTQESELATTAAKYGVENAAFAADEAQYKDTQGWKAYETAIAAGDFSTAAENYKAVTGKDISMEQMKTYQTYQNTKQQQDITSGEQAIAIQNANLTQLQASIGDTAWKSIQTMIDDGASFSQVNERLKIDGKTALTDVQFKGMLDATPLGERTYNRKLTGLQTLLTAGGTENIAAAQKGFNEMYPELGGVIDFSNAITESNRNTFNAAVTDINKFVSIDTDWDKVPAASKADFMKSTGLDATQAESFYRSMKTNTIDAAMKDYLGSEMYKDMTDPQSANYDPEQAKAWEVYWQGTLLGFGGARAVKSYDVYDTTGNKTGTFTDKAKADQAALKIGGTTKTSYAITTEAATQPGDSSTPVTLTASDRPAGITQGQVYLKDGKAYTVGSADEDVETKMPTDPWNSTGDAIIKAGLDGNPLYQGLIDARVSDITTNEDYSKLKGLTSDDPIYKAVFDSMSPASFSYRNRIGFNDEFTGAPAKNTWIKINTSQGEKILRVTFNGLLNTGGTSDRAYMELQDADGNMYSTDGASSSIISGVNTTYTKKGG